MFKIGDIVRCIDSSGYEHKIANDEIYEILDIEDDFVQVITYDGKGFYKAKRFILVKDDYFNTNIDYFTITKELSNG